MLAQSFHSSFSGSEPNSAHKPGLVSPHGLPMPVKEIESWRLVMITMAMGGVYLGFGLQVGGGTAVMQASKTTPNPLPLLLTRECAQNMGISSSFVSAVWLFGPISGIIMGPLIGSYSDHCQSKLGRRRPVSCAAPCPVLTQRFR